MFIERRNEEEMKIVRELEHHAFEEVTIYSWHMLVVYQNVVGFTEASVLWGAVTVPCHVDKR